MARWLTVFEVLFFKSLAKSIVSKEGLKNYSAIVLTHLGTVAEKSKTCTSYYFYAMIVPMIFSTSSLKPNFSI